MSEFGQKHVDNYAGRIFIKESRVVVTELETIPAALRVEIKEKIFRIGVATEDVVEEEDRMVIVNQTTYEIAQKIAEVCGRTINYRGKQERLALRRKRKNSNPECGIEIDQNAVLEVAKRFAQFLKENSEEIISVLLKYETYNVAKDEISRTIETLEDIGENMEYYRREVGSVAVFLPSNQPLYALTCFGILPSLMAQNVFVKAPKGMQHFFPELMEAVNLQDFFPNISITCEDHQTFTKKHSQLTHDEKGIFKPTVDVVIFTGTPDKAAEVRHIFDKRVLMITNGSGHNPLVVTETADIDKALDSTLRAQLYNQGQDCASPNSILVHRSVYEEFTTRLAERLKEVKVGPYSDRKNTVGPINRMRDLGRIQAFIEDSRAFISQATEGVIRVKSQIVEPTIIEKPLSQGGNFTEQFAPIFFIQSYDTDNQLAQYFEDPRYARHAMYVVVFGKSKYVDNLKETGLHDETTIIYDIDLLAAGVEKGTKPYGGFGSGASYVSINGQSEAKPTLPQRDIFEYLVKPNLQS